MICLDESQSLPLDWVDDMFTELDANLQSSGIGTGTVPNRYALIGFGCAQPSHHTGIVGYPAEVLTANGAAHKHYVGGDDWGNLADALTAIALFNPAVADTGYIPPSEDVYAALRKGYADYTWRDDVPRVLMIITDEDRNQRVYAEGDTQAQQFASIKADILSLGAHIAGIMNQRIVKNEGGYPAAVGMDSTGKVWVADGAGGFTTDTNGVPGSYLNNLPLDFGTASAGGASTLTDSDKAWTVNQWVGENVRILDGTGVAQIKTIASNTATQLTITGTWTTNPDATSEYQIEDSNIYDDPQFPSGTKEEYFDLLVNDDVQGSAWDVQPLIGGDPNAISSFTGAFVDSIEDNIVEQLQWVFLGWYENGVLVSSDADYTFTAEENRTLVARFTRQLI
jgi:hypothetical protein